MSGNHIPESLQYTKEHEWVQEGTDTSTVRIGITDFAQDALGDVVYVSLPTVGDRVAAGDAIGEIESTKSVSELYAPLDGEVVAVNEGLNDHPEQVNADPYGEGWVLELRVEADRSGLLDAAAYENLINPSS